MELELMSLDRKAAKITWDVAAWSGRCTKASQSKEDQISSAILDKYGYRVAYAINQIIIRGSQLRRER